LTTRPSAAGAPLRTSAKRNLHCEKIMMVMNTNTTALATTP
jgi:hypothetical protein